MSEQNNTIVFSGPVSLWEVLLRDWRFWLPGAVFSLLFASIVMLGWRADLLSGLTSSYLYGGDGLSHSWLVQRAIEGWIFDNPRSGYPFGSSFLDYPGSDSGSHFILKILGWLTGEYSSAIDLYVFFSFFTSFIAAFVVLRTINLNVWYSLAAAGLFVFLPFHLQRLGHLYYTWYFVIPLFFYMSFYFFYWNPENEKKFSKPRNLFLWSVILLGMASFGVYYALFGSMLLIVGGVAGWIKSGYASGLKWAFLAVLAIIIGVLINTAPNLVNKYKNGTNDQVAVRAPAEAEDLGFKMMQLILPRDNHRVKRFSEFRQKYNNTTPLVNENSTSTLGLVGSIGFLLLGGVLFVRLSGSKVDSRLALLALLTLVLFLFGTIGGLGSFFSFFISSSIRAWNRISIFIGFGVIAAAFIFAQIQTQKYLSTSQAKWSIFFSAGFVLALGLYDQTTPICEACITHMKSTYETDKAFIQKIEHSLPSGSAIYQLPYIAFPETPPLHRLGGYDLLKGFLHSKSLRWNSGGMKGREGDFFYYSLSQEPIKKQLEVIERLGFAGIYVDRRGYVDNAKNLIDSLTKLIGPPALISHDEEIVFFRLKSVNNVNFDGLTNEQITQQVNYMPNTLGVTLIPTQHSFKQIGTVVFNKKTNLSELVAEESEKGYLHYGPYIKVDSGYYYAIFDIESPDLHPKGVKMDVTTQGGNVVLGVLDISDGKPPYTINFKVDKPELVEFRVSSLGESKIILKKIFFKKKKN